MKSFPRFYCCCCCCCFCCCCCWCVVVVVLLLISITKTTSTITIPPPLFSEPVNLIYLALLYSLLLSLYSNYPITPFWLFHAISLFLATTTQNSYVLLLHSPPFTQSIVYSHIKSDSANETSPWITNISTKMNVPL